MWSGYLLEEKGWYPDADKSDIESRTWPRKMLESENSPESSGPRDEIDEKAEAIRWDVSDEMSVVPKKPHILNLRTRIRWG